MKKKVLWSIVVLFLLLFVSVFYFYRKEVVIEDNFSKQLVKIEDNFNNNNLDQAINDSNLLLSQSETGDQKIFALLSLASVYAQKGSIQFNESTYGNEAIKYAKQVLEVDPNNSEAYRVIGYSYEIMENYPEAIKNYNKATELNPQNANAFGNLGHTYALQSDYENAEKNLLTAFNLDKTLDHALYNLARLSFIKKDLVKAKFYLEETIKFSKSSRFLAESYDLLGLLDLQNTNFDKAIENFNLAIKFDSSYAGAYVHLANAKLDQLSAEFLAGNSDFFSNNRAKYMMEAGILADKALSINPELTVAMIVKSKVLIDSKKIEETIEILKKAKANLPKDISLNIDEKKKIGEEIDMRINIFTNDVTVTKK